MKKDTEVKLLMQERRKGTSQRLAAARAGMSERTARKYEQVGQLPSHLKRPHTCVFVNDIGDQFLIRIGARDPFERVNAHQIWGPVDNEKREPPGFLLTKKGATCGISPPLLAPTESPKRFPNRSFPRRCRSSPRSCCLSNVCRRPNRVPDSRCGLLLQSHAKSRPRRRRGSRVRARWSWP